MKMLKSIFVALLFHLIMLVNILLQIAIYDTSESGSVFVFLFLTGAYGAIVYFVSFWAFDNDERKIYWSSVATFALLYVVFICFVSKTYYFTWLFRLTVPRYSNTYYEIGIHALLTGLTHTVAYVISSVIYLKTS